MIRIISRKVPACYSMNFGVYVNKLTEIATNQPGFIKSESYWCREHHQILSMSDWESKNHWERWYNCKQRNDLSKRYREYVREEHFHILHKTTDKFHNFFLL